VREAVEGLLKHDASVIVVEDAVKELSLKERDQLFSRWKRKGVCFMKPQEVLAALI
jgi:hypothetical protein